MPFDKLKYPDELREERRENVRRSVRAITLEEMRKIVRTHEEEFRDDPAREEFLRLIAEQPNASYYHAIAQEGVEVFYCGDADFGVWVLSGSGLGPLDATARSHMKEAIEALLSGQRMGGKK